MTRALAVDLGGTHVRFRLVEDEDDGRRRPQPVHVVETRGVLSFEAALGQWRERARVYGQLDTVAIAAAGPVARGSGADHEPRLGPSMRARSSAPSARGAACSSTTSPPSPGRFLRWAQTTCGSLGWAIRRIVRREREADPARVTRAVTGKGGVHGSAQTSRATVWWLGCTDSARTFLAASRQATCADPGADGHAAMAVIAPGNRARHLWARVGRGWRLRRHRRGGRGIGRSRRRAPVSGRSSTCSRNDSGTPRPNARCPGQASRAPLSCGRIDRRRPPRQGQDRARRRSRTIAFARADPVAEEAIAAFTGFLGSVAGDLALTPRCPRPACTSRAVSCRGGANASTPRASSTGSTRRAASAPGWMSSDPHRDASVSGACRGRAPAGVQACRCILNATALRRTHGVPDSVALTGMTERVEPVTREAGQTRRRARSARSSSSSPLLAFDDPRPDLGQTLRVLMVVQHP